MSPFIAAAIDWLETLLPALFVGWWILSQILTVFQRPKKKASEKEVFRGKKIKPVRTQTENVRPLDQPVSTIQKPKPKPKDRIEPQKVSSKKVDSSRRKIEQEIEEFLTKRDAESHTQIQQDLRSEGTQSKETRRRTASMRDRASDPSSGLSVEAFLERNTTKESVAEHVYEAFAHDLKHEVPNEEPAKVPNQTQSVSQSFATLLRDPQTLRHLIVMREILDRPIDRW